MEHTYYTVAQVAEMLKMHEKTVQRYIREGKLRAAKVGKAWRITGHDLSLFTQGNKLPADGKAKTSKKIMVSSVIDIDVDSMDEGINLINMISASLNSKQQGYGKSSMNAQFIEQDSRVRIMFYGDVKLTEDLMWVLSNYNNQGE
ncbi:MAG: helix-turn-helix domain-containing protein [Clostridia bacterium]|nr:helix-turn-helix domain-containing protein [Clostridia bacterium]